MNVSYKNVIDDLFKSNSHFTIANHTDEQVANAYENFFKNAQKEVVILCDKLNPNIFDKRNVYGALKQFLDDGKKLYIALDEKPDENMHDFLLVALNYKYKDQVFVWFDKKVIGKNLKKLYFTVMDDVAYRFEEDGSDCGVLSANDPKFAKKLLKTFKNVID